MSCLGENMSEKEHYKLTIEPITCVHIGTGETLTPLDYKLTMFNGELQYFAYSVDAVMNRIVKNREKDIRTFRELNRLSNSNDMNVLVEFFNENADKDGIRKSELLALCPTTQDFKNCYHRNAEKNLLENAGEVLQIYRNGLSPVIPGSSLKGSIRTAVLNNRHCRSGYADAKKDPFRAVEIGDCEFSGKGSQLVGMLKIIGTKKQNNTQLQAEVIKGYLINDIEVNGNCRIAINKELIAKNYLQEPVSIEEIVRSCNNFYLRTFEKEYNEFYANKYESVDFIKTLRTELHSVKNTKDQFVIRVGRWSQKDFVTVDNDKFGTTRTVFNYDGQYLPLGWCKCTVKEM